MTFVEVWLTVLVALLILANRYNLTGQKILMEWLLIHRDRLSALEQAAKRDDDDNGKRGE